jgi:hypothetical protein
MVCGCFFRRPSCNWMQNNVLVSQTTPCRLPPKFWLFYVTYSCLPSHFEFPMFGDHVHMVLGGVMRLGKSKSTCLISLTHTYPFTSTPITPTPSQDFSLSSTVYTHATPMILAPWTLYISHTHHPSSPPFTFSAELQVAEGCMYLLFPVFYTPPRVLSDSWWTPGRVLVKSW